MSSPAAAGEHVKDHKGDLSALGTQSRRCRSQYPRRPSSVVGRSAGVRSSKLVGRIV